MGVENMKPDKIKDLIKKANTTPAALARDKDVSATAMYQVIKGSSVSRALREHIAKAVCMVIAEHKGLDYDDAFRRTLELIWPETYLAPGGPREPGRPLTRGLYDHSNQAA